MRIINLIKQLYIEYKASKAIPYIAFHPELGVPVGIFNTKDEPNRAARIRSIKRMGTKGNLNSYNIALLLGISNPIPSFVVYNRRVSARPGRFATSRPATSPAGGRGQIEQLARQLAEQILRERDAAAQRARLGRIFTQFDSTNDVLPNNVEIVTRGLFFGNTGSLINMFLNSNLTATQQTYFQDIFSTGDPATNALAAEELSIAYGNFGGSGSSDLTGNLNDDTPTRAIYKQYAQILLAPNDKKFTFNGVDSNNIYVLNFNRSRMREKLDPGNFELTLARLSGSSYTNPTNLLLNPQGNLARLDQHTGSNVVLDGSGRYIQLIDDSGENAGAVADAGQIFNIVSGTLDGGAQIHNPANPIHYGLMFPQHGVVILNGDVLDTNVGFGTSTGSGLGYQGENAIKLFKSLSGSDALTPATVNGGIQARSSEQVKSTYYFVRVKNAEYNYSNNPSYTTGSLGELIFSTFINDPQTYITTVGMYNERRELLAVAKLSQPLLKNFTREALIKVKLDF